MKKVLYLLVFGLFYSLSIFSQETSLIVDCQTPGWLSNMINYGDQQTVRNLKVTGYINDTDLEFIGSLTQNNLNGVIDLGEANIVSEFWCGAFRHKKESGKWGTYISVYDYEYHLQKLILPKGLKSYNEDDYTGEKQEVDTLVFDTKVNKIEGYDSSHRNYRTDIDPTFHRKIGHLILGENIDSIISIRTANSVFLPQFLKYIDNYAFNGRQDFSQWNIREFPNLEYLGYCAFTYDSPGTGQSYFSNNQTLPDSIYFPSIKQFCMSSFDYKEGMHIFFGDKLENIFDDDNVAWTDKFHSTINMVSFHFKTMLPPSTGMYYCSSSCIIYVPKGAKQAYLDSGQFSKFTIIEETSTYSLNITASGNGCVSYSGSTIKNQMKLFTVNEGSSATILFSPDSGNKIKSVKVNDTDVTSILSDNSYIINNISGDITIEVDFEIIPSIISFADSNVKSLCVANWDTDGDGELSENEAAAVTNLRYVFKDNRDITSFDELQYFTGLNSIGEHAFYYCTKLKSIIIPANVTTIGNNAFFDCESLSSIVIPKNVISIGTGAFLDCGYGLSSILVESGNPKYDSRNNSNAIIETATNTLLWGCNNTVIPSDVKGIGNSAFSHCLNIKSITLPEGLTSIGNWAFYNCRSISVVDIPDNVLSIGQEAFWHCNALHSVTIGKSVTSIGDCAFEQSSNLSLVVSRIQNPFNISETVFSSISTNAVLQVPHGTKNLYEACTGWIQNFKEVIAETYNYTLSISASGNGSATYNNTVIRSKTESFTVVEGSKVSVSLNPDNGCRIKSVKENNADVTAYVTNQTYVINSISRNTTIEVEFEAIPIVTYSLSIKSAGNGSVVYNGTSIRNTTTTFTVNEGTSQQATLSPDEGYRVASVKLNNEDVTSAVANNSYTITNLSADANLEVTFEAIPPTTYSLDISVTGSGSATYNNTVIRGKTESFTVVEGGMVSVSLNPDNGYRIKSVKENDMDVTAYVTNQTYVINFITRNSTIEVEFEAIPIVTYSLSIKSAGNGSVVYNGTSIRNTTTTFTVNEGTSPQVTLNPDDGYRVASVKLNNVDVTANVYNNRYTIANISGDANLDVTFEAIPPTTYSLTITASGNGSVTYGSANLKNQTQTFTVNEGDNASLTISPESGFRIASVKVNNVDVTAQVVNNLYTISKIITNTTVSVTFEAIPVMVYQLSIAAYGNGSATYDGTTVRGETKTFAVNEGTDVTIAFSPDNGNSISSVKVNGNDVTADVVGNHYTINGMSGSMAVEVTFMEDVNALTVDGVNYTVTSQTDRTICVTGGNYGQVLTVPARVNQNGQTWTVTGIEKDALKGITNLTAVIWNAEAAFTASVNNPNLLLYVKAEEYAPNGIRNVVVNGTASNITLVEALNGNDFYCPQAFVAQHISFTHHYDMTTGVQEARGWETIALPFDVQTITHASKGTIVPFEAWNGTSTAKPFWLYEMTGNGFVKASEIKAYTPYIISMPNNSQYTDEWLLNGNVTFEASGVYVDVTDNLHTAQQGDRTFVPCFLNRSSYEGLYALNVNNDYSQNQTGVLEGSRFVLNMRQVHPFEAYMTTGNNARAFIPIFEDGLPTDISDVSHLMNNEEMTNRNVYNLNGQRVEHPKKGLYIINGKKVVVK